MSQAALGQIDGLGSGDQIIWAEGLWVFDEDDLLVMALLQDPIFATELCWYDPANREYGSCYRVRDYQYPLFRIHDRYAGAACGRSVGKTESIKARAFTHAFRRVGENLLVTAPELIHLLPLTDSIEDRIQDTRITREFLDTRNQKSGFTHRPFQVDFQDGTKIVGRIPKVTGTGVKGQHQPDLIVEEAQDYPEKGWVEIHESQPLDALILTPEGYVMMGELEVGDEVLGQDGSPTEVLDVLDHGEREVWRIHFSDGSWVECDPEHLWTVERKTGRWKTRRASELRIGDGVPSNGPAAFRGAGARDLRVDPYTLGVLLGDGSMSRSSLYLSSVDDEIITALEDGLDPGEELVPVGGCDYRLRKRGPRTVHSKAPLHQALVDLGLWGLKSYGKFVPYEYQVADQAVRLAILQGLVDSDGNVDIQGAVRFSSASQQLRDDVEFLVRSLGGCGNKGEQVDRRGFATMYTFRFRLPVGVAPCRLKRKRERVKDLQSNSYRRSVVRIEKVGSKPVRCVEVAADDGLYLTENFIPTHNTVEKDHTDAEGNPDFSYHFYGVHSGRRDSGFFKRVNEGVFKLVQITAIQRPGWSAEEKEAAKAAYGGTSSPDYRRNIYGEPGSAASPYFVTSRLIACVDQERESRYNEIEYVHQELRAEELDDMRMSIGEALNLPPQFGDIYCGADIGLTTSPTEICVFSHETVDKVPRLKLIRRYTLERFRERSIREAMSALGWHFGGRLMAFGIDATGLGAPIFQAMEDDETAPGRLLEVQRGYKFNALVPVNVDESFIAKDSNGQLRDQFGSAVKMEVDPKTGIERPVTYMPMIEASTRYLRDFVDDGFFLLPFDTAITTDMQGETQQRVKAVGERKGKPNMFHILDSFRAMGMAFKADEIEAQLNAPPDSVLDAALDLSDVSDGSPLTGGDVGGMFG